MSVGKCGRGKKLVGSFLLDARKLLNKKQLFLLHYRHEKWYNLCIKEVFWSRMLCI